MPITAAFRLLMTVIGANPVADTDARWRGFLTLSGLVAPLRLGLYVKRWNGWVKGGLEELRSDEVLFFPPPARPDPYQPD